MKGRFSITSSEFERTTCIPVHKSISQASLYSIYEFLAKICPNFFDEIYVYIYKKNKLTRVYYKKLNVSCPKTNGECHKTRALMLAQI